MILKGFTTIHATETNFCPLNKKCYDVSNVYYYQCDYFQYNSHKTFIGELENKNLLLT